MIRIAVAALVIGTMGNAFTRDMVDAQTIDRAPLASYVPDVLAPLQSAGDQGGAGDVLPDAPPTGVPGDLRPTETPDRSDERRAPIVADVPSVRAPLADAPRSGATYTATYLAPSLAGNPAGCGGRYFPDDATYAAVGYALAASTPCGAALTVCGAGGCVSVTRRDSCPGCDAHGNMIDLSEAANMAVCGRSYPASCLATVTP